MEELTIKQMEFKRNLVEITNKSELPAFLIALILKETLSQVAILENQEYENAIKEKEKSQNEEN